MSEKPTRKTTVKKPAVTVTKTPAKRKPVVRKVTAVDPTKISAIAAGQLAIEKKATNVKLLDLHGITSMTDYFVIASASSDIQVKAIADHILKTMREKYEVTPWKSEGWDTRKWIIVDYVDFVVHIFHEEARDFYGLERLWADAPTEELHDVALTKKRNTKKKVSE
jgi:ribosome-associated protein